MEVEVKLVSMDARLEYLQGIAENQQVVTKKFPWAIANVFFILGAGATYVVVYYQNDQREKRKKPL